MTDENTEKQIKLDRARILISFNIFAKIPSSLVITFKENEFRVSLSVVETNLDDVCSSLERKEISVVANSVQVNQNAGGFGKDANGRLNNDITSPEDDSNEELVKRKGMTDSSQHKLVEGASECGFQTRMESRLQELDAPVVPLLLDSGHSGMGMTSVLKPIGESSGPSKHDEASQSLQSCPETQRET